MLQQRSLIWRPTDMRALLEALDRAASDLPAETVRVLRHLELVVLQQLARRGTWTQPLLQRLRNLREDPDLGLRSVALDVDTQQERQD